MSSGKHQHRIAVLRGGLSEEQALSMQTGKEVSDILRANGYEVVDVLVSKAGEWLEHGLVREPNQILDRVDSVYIGLHGLYGEDGTVQRILERHGNQYVGSKPYQSSIGMHKMLTKEHLSDVPVRLPKHMQVSKVGVSDLHALSGTIETLLGNHYLLKPMRGGSGIGQRRASGSAELATALSDMFNSYEDILVEEYIEGTDATCGVISGLRDSALYTTPVVEIIGGSADIFVAEKIAPGRFSKELKDKIAALTGEIYQTLELSDLARADFRVTPDGEIYFLEVNTLPAVTKDSPLMAGLEAVGVSQEELICHLCGDRIV